MNPYHIRTAISGLWKERWIYLLSTMSIGVGLFILALGIVAVFNLHALAMKLPERFSMTVYLKDDVTAEETDRLREALRASGGVRKITYISKEEAMRELRSALRDSESLLEGLGDNPLPASLDVKLRKEFVKSAQVDLLAKEAGAMRGVSDVQYGKEFLGSIQSVTAAARTAGAAFLAVLLLGIIFVCYSTVKILFYRKTEEVETLKLLGATAWFIRAPFLLEGVLMGLAGGLLALAGGFALFEVFFVRFSPAMPVLRHVVLPPHLIYGLPVAGLFIGLAGAAAALGRIRF
jgi:cell division transport system permease protein